MKKKENNNLFIYGEQIKNHLLNNQLFNLKLTKEQQRILESFSQFLKELLPTDLNAINDNIIINLNYYINQNEGREFEIDLLAICSDIDEKTIFIFEETCYPEFCENELKIETDFNKMKEKTKQMMNYFFYNDNSLKEKINFV